MSDTDTIVPWDSDETIEVTEPCDECGGEGVVEEDRPWTSNYEDPGTVEVECDCCGGSGEIEEVERLIAELIEENDGEYTHTDGTTYRWATEEEEAEAEAEAKEAEALERAEQADWEAQKKTHDRWRNS